jgi:hypothetical protein
VISGFAADPNEIPVLLSFANNAAFGRKMSVLLDVYFRRLSNMFLGLPRGEMH